MRRRITHASDEASARLLLQCLPVARIIVKHSRAHEIKFVQLNSSASNRSFRIENFIYLSCNILSIFFIGIISEEEGKKEEMEETQKYDDAIKCI